MTDADWIKANAAALRAADTSLIAIETKLEHVNRRFQLDPAFHAKVYTVAKYLDAHVLPPERELGDRDGRWADALMSAIAATAVLEVLESREREW